MADRVGVRWPGLRRLYGTKVRRRWWSLLNRARGLKWCPVGRFRCCDHTTPFHYEWCRNG